MRDKIGMSIDECIDYFRRSYAIDDTDDARQHNEVMEYTIDTMRKYQKIQEIVKNTDRNADTVRNALAFGDIAKVVEDGKID